MHYLLFSAGELYPEIDMITEIEEIHWVFGRPLGADIPELRFELDGEGSFAWFDFIRPGPNIPLVSPRMREALTKAGVDNVEYFPARIKDRTTNEERPYFGANIIGLVSAMDRAKSEFRPLRRHPVRVLDISKLVVDEERCAHMGLFRLAELDLLILVDEPVKDELERQDMQGLRIVRPDEWDGFTA
jgi:uncharacterized protein DUF1629